MQPELDDTLAPPAPDPAKAATLPGDRTATAPGSSRDEVAGDELPAGLRLGHFRIDKKLGAGGMGEVYLATDLALDRPVAIKVLPAGVGSGSARERLIREARAQARVHHPNVAHIYFIGEEGGRLYFAMEYVTGKTLAERIADKPLAVEDALAMIRAAALGLREAQRSGFTHRDVKPSNLMLDGHDVLKVLDFGLASGAPDVATEGPVAQTTMAGTPLYMAPEQAHGEPIDFRADIYALGATLYHLVSGRPPFHADTVAELVTLHENAARPAVPRGSNPRTSIVAIDALVARMMAPRPEDRFGSYDELLRAIELASVQHSRPAGFWVRTVATGVDLMLIALITGIVSNVATGGGDIALGRASMTLCLVYRIIALRRWGTTAGKALLELEVVSITTGSRPTWAQVIRREGWLAVLPLSMAWADLANKHLDVISDDDLFGLLGAGMVIILMFRLLHASLRVPGKRAIWDQRSGTMVRYRQRGPS